MNYGMSPWRTGSGPGLLPGATRQSLVDGFLRDFFAPLGEAPRASAWSPPVDVIETPDAYRIVAELPGLKQDELEVTLTADTLTISGARKQEERQEGEQGHVLERTSGSFQRTFRFPTPVASGSVQAELAAGILRVEVPKADESKPRRIEVRTA